MNNSRLNELDATDRAILAALQEDARMPNKEIANRIHLAPSATSERLKKLREHGIIDAFETRVNSEKLGIGLLAFVFVRTTEMGRDWSTGKRLAEIDEVQEVYNISGEDCYLIKVRARDPKALGRLLRDKVKAIPTVVATRSTIVMDIFKETCRLPLAPAVETAEKV